jgi:chromosome segregation ATPase
MNELNIPYYIFIPWTLLCILFIYLFSKNQKKKIENRNKFWSNSYIFDTIPSTFPTLGILCTAIGIIIGLQDFNTDDIQKSIPTLLKGLRLAFYATVAGIIGLIIFQKLCAIVQKSIDDDPSRPPKQSDEITALSNLNYAIVNLQKETVKGFENTQESFEKSIKESVKTLEEELKEVKSKLNSLEEGVKSGFVQANKANETNTKEITSEISKLREESANSSAKANENTAEIILAMGKNNELIRNKFDEFSELLKKNNTEALVEVMKRATEEFNQQMASLINKLVQENFAELNNSVKSLNDWQKENKEQIAQLTDNFKKTTESFAITAKTLNEVASKTESLTNDNGKLSLMIKELSKVLIEDGKFQEVTIRLLSTVETLSQTTDSFDETTNKLNGWVRTQMTFNDKAEILIKQLEDFKNLNGEVWDKYRAKMEESVGIISKASKSLGGDLNNINQQFIESLNSTLTSLDECIQRIVISKK